MKTKKPLYRIGPILLSIFLTVVSCSKDESPNSRNQLWPMSAYTLLTDEHLQGHIEVKKTTNDKNKEDSFFEQFALIAPERVTWIDENRILELEKIIILKKYQPINDLLSTELKSINQATSLDQKLYAQYLNQELNLISIFKKYHIEDWQQVLGKPELLRNELISLDSISSRKKQFLNLVKFLLTSDFYQKLYERIQGEYTGSEFHLLEDVEHLEELIKNPELLGAEWKNLALTFEDQEVIEVVNQLNLKQSQFFIGMDLLKEKYPSIKLQSIKNYEPAYHDLYAARLKTHGIYHSPELVNEWAQKAWNDVGSYEELNKVPFTKSVEMIQAYERSQLQIQDWLKKEKTISVPKTNLLFYYDEENLLYPYPIMYPNFMNGEPYVVIPQFEELTKNKMDFLYKDSIKVVLIHEGRPGHELQEKVMNKAKLNNLRKNYLFNTALVEGWALYAESMMEETSIISQDEKKYFKHFYRTRIARALIDYKIHHHHMDKDEAINFLKTELNLSEGFAQNEVNRILNDPGRESSYFYGLIILENEFKTKTKSNLPCYYDHLLKSGYFYLNFLKEILESSKC
jgi:hypothetical protein